MQGVICCEDTWDFIVRNLLFLFIRHCYNYTRIGIKQIFHNMVNDMFEWYSICKYDYH